MGLRLLLFTILCSTLLCGSSYERRQNARARSIRAQFGPGSEPALGRRLTAMGREDQEIRQKWIGARGTPEQDALAMEQARIDRKLTGELRDIVLHGGWPTYERAGYDGAQAAILILIHSPDIEFQRQWLPELRPLAETGRIPSNDVAILTDKLLLADGKPQRYGTQFKIQDGALVMEPVDDPEHLDARRRAFNLMPLTEYQKNLRKMYKLKKPKKG